MKKFILFPTILASIVIPSILLSFSGSGSGTKEDPYQITNLSQLQEMNDDLSAHYILMNDIDASEQGFESIGDDDRSDKGYTGENFTGSFDGQNFIIDSLHVDGLFEFVENRESIIQNVKLTNCNIIGGDYTGAIAAYCNGTIINCEVQGNVVGKDYTGGLVGVSTNVLNSSFTGTVEGDNKVGGLIGFGGDTVSNCFTNVTVESREDEIGGLIGQSFMALIDNCYSEGLVEGDNKVGGLIGLHSQTCVYNSNSSCSVKGDNEVGGLIGYIESKYTSEVIDCYATGDIECGRIAGGLVGYNLGKILRSFASGNVTGNYHRLGGLVGDNQGIIKKSYAIGNITSKWGNYIGGLVGINSGNILNSYARGNVTSSEDYAGGFVGANKPEDFCYGLIRLSYSTGKVAVDAENIGGFSGFNEGSIIGCFFDKESSEIEISDGGIGKSTDEMKNIDTYLDEGWNFDFIWKLNNNYPEIEINSSFRPSDTDNNGKLNITSITDLRWLSESDFDQDKSYELDNYINAVDTRNWNGGEGFYPIDIFSGFFEGNEFTIDSLYINRQDGCYNGLFGKIKGIPEDTVYIKNLKLLNCSIIGFQHTGALAGRSGYQSEYKNVINLNNIEISGVVLGKDNYAGGLCGSSNMTKITHCKSQSFVHGKDYTGGLCGFFYSDCSSTNIIPFLQQSYVNGDTKGRNNVGGLVGKTDEAVIKDAYAVGKVEGDDYVGGLVGKNFDSYVYNGYSSGKVTGYDYVGGLIGDHDPYYNQKAKVESSYWDFQNSRISDSDKGYPRDSIQMKIQSTFSGWDFNNVWCMAEGKTYPQLQYFVDCDTLTSVIEEIYDNAIEIYPNPAEDYIDITFCRYSVNKGLQPLVHGGEFEIYDVLGEKIMSESIHPMTRSHRMNVSNLPKGVYFVRFGGDVKKFVKI
jgi:hypothetical protein